VALAEQIAHVIAYVASPNVHRCYIRPEKDSEGSKQNSAAKQSANPNSRVA
jgi:hypothetical protein